MRQICLPKLEGEVLVHRVKLAQQRPGERTQKAFHLLHGHLVEESQLSETGGIEIPGGLAAITGGEGRGRASVKIGSVFEKADGYSLGSSDSKLGHGAVEGGRGPAHHRTVRRVELDTAKCSAQKAEKNRGFHTDRPEAPSRLVFPEMRAPSMGSIGRRGAGFEGECPRQTGDPSTNWWACCHTTESSHFVEERPHSDS